MTDLAATPKVEKMGTPAVMLRLFGWSMLTILAAFLINNILNVVYGTPQITHIPALGMNTGAFVTLGVYAAALIASFAYVRATPKQALRWDANQIHQFNCYIVRALFWSVFFVGIADAVLAFLRIEDFLTSWFSVDFAREFGRAAFVAPYIHVPMIVLGFVVALFSRTLGFHWLAALIAAAELGIVLSRFIFSYEQAFMGDLVRYWYAALFLFASAYTLFDEGHVRVDIVFAGLNPRTKGSVNAIGTVFLGMSTAWVILIVGMSGPTSMINAPVRTFEVSQSGSAGMYIKYQMAVFIGLFAVTMLIQFVSYFFEAVADKREEPGRREISPVSH